MRPIRTALLTAFAAAAIAGGAIAASSAAHVLLVRLPDGSVERIRYTGDVAPRVVLVPRAAPVAFADPFGAMFANGSPFAMMDRLSAEMDRRTDAMMRQAATLAAHAPAIGGTGITMASAGAGAMPAGTQSYSVVSTTINGKTCTRSTRLIAGSAGAQPRLISQSAGDCGGVAAPAAPRAPALTAQPAPVAAPARITPVRLETAPAPAPVSRTTI